MSAISGILNVNKPPGATSMDVVRLAKRLTKQGHVGHGGTLDPQASGVLPVCFGQATRTMDFLINGTKLYRGEVTFGVATDTYDSTGKVLEERDWSGLTLDRVRQALEGFRGMIPQVPPMFSARKHEGQRLYQLARMGREVPRLARRVQVYRLEITSWEPPRLGLEVECGRGVYIRAIAHDLGQVLGCGAHLSSLSRMRNGPFSLEESLSLQEATETFRDGSWLTFLYPSDTALLNLSAAVVSERAEAYIRTGQAIPLPSIGRAAVHEERCRAYTADGRFLALLRFHRARRLWHPETVFIDSKP